MDLDLFKYLPLNASWGYMAFGASLVLVVLKWIHLYSGVRAQNFKSPPDERSAWKFHAEAKCIDPDGSR